jgi:polygalacturonase
MKYPTLGRALFLVAALAAFPALAAQYNVRDYGATGDGKTLDNGAINKAIEAAAGAGGGTVYLPAGNYLCYSIHLKSHVTLALETGTTIIAAEPSEDGKTGYDPAEPNQWEFYQDYGHTHWHNSLIWGEDLHDVAIVGPGKIYGRGLSKGFGKNRRDLLPEERAEKVTLPIVANLPAEGSIKPGPFGYPGQRDVLAPMIGNKAIALKNCRNVIFRDFTIYHGGHFAILGTGVDNWTIDNLKIDTNRDGIDIDCSQNVRVSNCTVNSPYDDGICPKSSFALGYNRPTENVTITNCQVSGYDEGTLLDGTRQRKVVYTEHGVVTGPTGRIKCGTEGNGGFRNITISNCVFEYCRGLALESVDGALMEDITVTNLAMRDVVNTPIFIRLGARLRGPEAKIGTARRIKISNVVAHNTGAGGGILISGLSAEPIRDLTLSNIFIDYQGGGTKEQGSRIMGELENGYPEPAQFGVNPAWALFARHVVNFSVEDVEFRALSEDQRPTVDLIDATDASFERVKFPHGSGAPTFLLSHVTGFYVHNSRGLENKSRPEAIESDKL